MQPASPNAGPSSSITSGLSDPSATDHVAQAQMAQDANGAMSNPVSTTQQVLDRAKRVADEAARVEAPKDPTMGSTVSADLAATPTASKRGGRGGQRASFAPHGSAEKTTADPATATPGAARPGVKRGRPPGRGRGGNRGGAKVAKRKRTDEDEGGDTDSSEEITIPLETMTKSGRAVSKPTSYVPPPAPSPVTGVKRRKTYLKKPESAVCKVCLRGTSPATNMIVFCDGCNTPYHRYCHHPPIDQTAIDQVDKEWFCQTCEKERVVPVADEQVANFIAAAGAPVEQRRKYFASLTPGMLVTLLTKATTLHPDLPVFAPDFKPATPSMPPPTPGPPAINGHGHPKVAPAAQTNGVSTGTPVPSIPSARAPAGVPLTDPDEDNPSYAEHPPTYPRPGHGLMNRLPPEKDDLQWLVEDDSKYHTFSHLYQVDPDAASSSLNGNMA
ncbi:PHD-finger [Teratosphaeria destructans]|uniref:PHD-finger n=1 Tax=Teratosphaeria destructans TaxID=418781 RepID=A0A9W7SV44_9PEZI|nr:PHD-finger [Teratosphaeria destructans]